MKTIRFIPLILVFVITGCTKMGMMHESSMGMMHESSLYERLGGKPAIDAVVEDFVNRLGGDTRIKNEKVKARLAAISIPNLKMHLANLICAGTGGPCKYGGRDMKNAHVGLSITSHEFDLTVEDLVTTLDKFKVPEKEKGELLAILGPMKKDIVQAE